MKKHKKKARWKKSYNKDRYVPDKKRDFIDCSKISEAEEGKLRSEVAICPKCDISYDTYADFVDHFAKKWYLVRVPGCPVCAGLVSKHVLPTNMSSLLVVNVD